MGRLLGPKCRLCRREGVKLYLRGARCDSAKCAVVRRDYPPGMHAWRRGKFSDYGVRIREKQRLKRYYGVLERQFRRYFELASKGRGNTGEKLLSLMERRLDNVVYRIGFASSRFHARHLVAHGHIHLNGRKHSAASTLVELNDVVSPGGKEKSRPLVQGNFEDNKGRTLPTWVELQEETLQARVVGYPTSEDLKEVLPIREQLIVEVSSR